MSLSPATLIQTHNQNNLTWPLRLTTHAHTHAHTQTHTHRVKVWADRTGVESSEPDKQARLARREKQLSVGSLHFTPHAGV